MVECAGRGADRQALGIHLPFCLPERRVRLPAVMLAMVLCAPSAMAQVASEVAVKSAFLLNFVRFTEWPADALAPGGPITICLSDNAVADALDGLAGNRVVDGHPLSPRRVAAGDALDSCTVLFIGRAASGDAPAMLARVAGRRVLTVSDVERFTELGGMIELYIEGDRMRFAVNLPATRASGLTLSSQLLSLARIVGR